MQEYCFLRKIIVEIGIGISVQTRIWLDIVISLRMSHGFKIRELYGQTLLYAFKWLILILIIIIDIRV